MSSKNRNPKSNKIEHWFFFIADSGSFGPRARTDRGFRLAMMSKTRDHHQRDPMHPLAPSIPPEIALDHFRNRRQLVACNCARPPSLDNPHHQRRPHSGDAARRLFREAPAAEGDPSEARQRRRRHDDLHPLRGPEKLRWPACVRLRRGGPRIDDQQAAGPAIGRWRTARPERPPRHPLRNYRHLRASSGRISVDDRSNRNAIQPGHRLLPARAIRRPQATIRESGQDAEGSPPMENTPPGVPKADGHVPIVVGLQLFSLRVQLAKDLPATLAWRWRSGESATWKSARCSTSRRSSSAKSLTRITCTPPAFIFSGISC